MLSLKEIVLELVLYTYAQTFTEVLGNPQLKSTAANVRQLLDHTCYVLSNSYGTCAGGGMLDILSHR